MLKMFWWRVMLKPSEVRRLREEVRGRLRLQRPSHHRRPSRWKRALALVFDGPGHEEQFYLPMHCILDAFTAVYLRGTYCGIFVITLFCMHEARIASNHHKLCGLHLKKQISRSRFVRPWRDTERRTVKWNRAGLVKARDLQFCLNGSTNMQVIVLKRDSGEMKQLLASAITWSNWFHFMKKEVYHQVVS